MNLNPRYLGLALAIPLLLPGCSTGPEPASAPADAVQPAAPVQTGPAGTIVGRIAFTGAAPAPEQAQATGFPGCMQGGAPVVEPVAVRNGQLMNVFVYIKSGLVAGKTYHIPAQPAVLDQKRCMFGPHVLGVMKDQDLKILNSDQQLHNVRAVTDRNEGFNFGLPVAGMNRTVKFTQPEVMIRFKCDVHGWMSAYVGVLDHPFFAVSGEDGAFRIAGVPPGEYVIEAWHEALGAQTQTVTVSDKQDSSLAFSFAGK